jgi:hypothetical protein
MSKTLEEIRKKLQALDARKGSAGTGSRDKTTYAHWNIPEGTTAILRLLPDANQDNAFFWAEKQIIKLTFPGIIGQDEKKTVEVQVPCVEMWTGKNTCPILNEVRPMWKDKSLEETARRYWVKRLYYAQGFVKQDPTNENDAPENPIRKFVIGPQIYAIIKAALLDPELENSPVDYVNGLDFFVNKTSKGGYADYGTSKWARKESSLTDDMLEAVDKYGLVDLSTYLPKRPTEENLAAMYEMFQASLDGELYDPARWASHYKPYGFDSAPAAEDDGGEGRRTTRSAPVPASRPTTVSTPKPTPVSEQEETKDNDPPFDPTPTKTVVTEDKPATSTGEKKSPQEILAMIRNRNK